MKTLVINGSPRGAGKIAQMMAMAGEIAGDDTEVLDVYRLDIKPCVGCMACRTTGVCSLKPDDAHRAAEMIRGAELIVVGTPTYWGNMSGGLKNLFDRLVPAFMAETKSGIPRACLKGKRGIIVAACTTPFPFNRLFGQSAGAVKAVKEILRTGGLRVSSVQIGGTKGMKEIPQRHIDRLTKLILRARRASQQA